MEKISLNNLSDSIDRSKRQELFDIKHENKFELYSFFFKKNF